MGEGGLEVLEDFCAVGVEVGGFAECGDVVVGGHHAGDFVAGAVEGDDFGGGGGVDVELPGHGHEGREELVFLDFAEFGEVGVHGEAIDFGVEALEGLGEEGDVVLEGVHGVEVVLGVVADGGGGCVEGGGAFGVFGEFADVFGHGFVEGVCGGDAGGEVFEAGLDVGFVGVEGCADVDAGDGEAVLFVLFFEGGPIGVGGDLFEVHRVSFRDGTGRNIRERRGGSEKKVLGVSPCGSGSVGGLPWDSGWGIGYFLDRAGRCS